MGIENLKTWSTDDLIKERNVLRQNIDELETFGINDLRMLNIITAELLRREEKE